jgi:hypothetical protein
MPKTVAGLYTVTYMVLNAVFKDYHTVLYYSSDCFNCLYFSDPCSLGTASFGDSRDILHYLNTEMCHVQLQKITKMEILSLKYGKKYVQSFLYLKNQQKTALGI